MSAHHTPLTRLARALVVPDAKVAAIQNVPVRSVTIAYATISAKRISPHAPHD